MSCSHPRPVAVVEPSVADVPTSSRTFQPALLAEPIPGDPLRVTIDRLANGLTVYISPDHSQPRVEAWVVIRAGGRHDPGTSTGLAHYLEHMMFKGTDRLGTINFEAEQTSIAAVRDLYKQLSQAPSERRSGILREIDRQTQAMAAYAIPNEFDRLYAGLGILDLNAYTSQEETAYSADVPASRLDTWAQVEGQRFVHPVFRLFLPELEAVYEEKNISLDDPDERVYDAMMAGLFPAHPYGTQTIIGHAKHLKTPAYGDMEAFFHRYYVPNNAAIMLAGDVDRTQIIPVLEQAFRAWQPKPLASEVTASLRGPDGRRETSLVAEGEQSVTLAWRTVPVGHPDELALVALDRLVDHRSRGLLHDKLLLPQRLPDASSSSELLCEGGYWSLQGIARDGQTLAEVEELLLEVVRDLQQGTFSAADLDAVLLHAQIDHKLALESRASRVAHMTAAYATGQEWSDYHNRLARFAELTPADIQRVAQRYLGQDVVVVLRREGVHRPPVLPKPKITAVAIDPSRESAFAQAIKSTPHTPKAPQLVTLGREVHKRPNTESLLLATRNRQSDLFSLTYQFEHGLVSDPLMCHALDLLERSGAGDDGPVSLQKQLHALGSSIKTECGVQEMRIIVNGIDHNLEPTLDLLRRWLQHPKFDDATLQALVANTLSQRRDEQAAPESVARALAAYAQLGDFNYYRLQASDEQLRTASGQQLRALIAGIAHLPHTKLYFGPRDLGALALELGERSQTDTPTQVRRYRNVTRPTLFFVDKPMAQATIEVLLPAGPLTIDEEPQALALQHLLGNDSSGVVFQELRESRGLAYSAYASFELPRRPGDEAALYAHVGTQAEKTITALQLVLEILKAPPLPSRFDNTRTSLLEEYLTAATSPRDIPYWFHRWQMRGYDGDPRAIQMSAIETLTLAELQTFAKKIVDTPPIISILGDRKRIDFDGLRRALPNLEIVELKPAQLFRYADRK